MTSNRINELRAIFATGKRGEVKAAGEELIAELKKRNTRQNPDRFSLREVMIEAEKMKWPEGLAEMCSDDYARVGWVYGKQAHPIVSLPAAMRTWRRNHEKWNGSGEFKTETKTPEGWNSFVEVNFPSYAGAFVHAPEYMRLAFARWKKEQKSGA